MHIKKLYLGAGYSDLGQPQLAFKDLRSCIQKMHELQYRSLSVYVLGNAEARLPRFRGIKEKLVIARKLQLRVVNRNLCFDFWRRAYG